MYGIWLILLNHDNDTQYSPDDTSESAFEALDQSSEGWLASCFTDADSPGDLYVAVDIIIVEIFF